MNKGRISTELVEAQEVIVDAHHAIVTHLLEISVDGVLTAVERTEHLLLLTEQGERQDRQLDQLMVFDLVIKWVRTTLNRGFGARRTREMRRDVVFDAYGAMAAE